MKTICFCVRVAFLSLALLTGCGSRLNPSAPTMPATASILPDMTLIPTRESGPGPLSLTPNPHPILLVTRLGQEIELNSIRLEPNEYVAFHTESLPQGIPVANGVEIAYRYLARVDFGLHAPDWNQPGVGALWPVSVMLSDGRRIQTTLGFKAHHNIHVTGTSDRFGNIDIELIAVQSLIFQNAAASVAIPTSPPGTNVITVEVNTGDFVQVADPRIFARCMYEVYCCHDETLRALPLDGQADLAFSDIKSAVFTDPNSVKVSLPDGSTSQAKLRACTLCPDTPWRLEGKAALGDFEIELASVRSITR